MLYFNRNIRYRCEEDFIIICDCKNLIDFELPLFYEPLLSALQKGYDELCPIGLSNEKELLDDFFEMEIISDKPFQNSTLNSDIWGALRYSENEFFV